MTPAGFETLLVEAPGPGAGLLAPGRIQRALALGAGIRAEEIGLMMPRGRGQVAVDISVQRAAGLATPRYLPFTDDASPALLMLRRDDDPEEEGSFWLRLTWPVGEAGSRPPTPGALSSALAEATRGAVGAETVGASFGGVGWMRIEVPERYLLALSFPMDLKVSGRTVRVSTKSTDAGAGERP
ncbi:MAG: hypothetical protein R3F39_04440 [Myxococcota bacterium]